MKKTALTAIVAAVILSTAGLTHASILNTSASRKALDNFTNGAQDGQQPTIATASGNIPDSAMETMKAKKAKKKGKKSKAS